MVCVPVNLVARIPDDVSDDTAVFTVLGAIALQGIRLAKPTLGECFAVYGLGLVGLLTVQLLRANGCRVMAIDFNPQRLELARSMGAEVCDLQTHPEPVSSAINFSRDRGGMVILTVATSSDDPIRYSAQMCRKLGGDFSGCHRFNLSRDDFKKEISFQASAFMGLAVTRNMSIKAMIIQLDTFVGPKIGTLRRYWTPCLRVQSLRVTLYPIGLS